MGKDRKKKWILIAAVFLSATISVVVVSSMADRKKPDTDRQSSHFVQVSDDDTVDYDKNNTPCITDKSGSGSRADLSSAGNASGATAEKDEPENKVIVISDTDREAKTEDKMAIWSDEQDYETVPTVSICPIIDYADSSVKEEVPKTIAEPIDSQNQTEMTIVSEKPENERQSRENSSIVTKEQDITESAKITTPADKEIPTEIPQITTTLTPTRIPAATVIPRQTVTVTPTITNTPTATPLPTDTPTPVHIHDWQPVYTSEWVDTSHLEITEAWDEEVWRKVQVCSSCQKSNVELGYLKLADDGLTMLSNDPEKWEDHCAGCLVDPGQTIGYGYHSEIRVTKVIHHDEERNWIKSGYYEDVLCGYVCSLCGEQK